ncbi:TetR/AcrR family transcriptional regulator [Deinococcus sedimenti]|uniref:TetR family transcriptional regulator n=1 Tax=Deinococcus sedimenti TaxID=1867090 RepID=A0ABQ2SB25_9DEIO|nr:TetR/AcrR family transcriptional regulator [Deinococcus sedimenti]GGS09658.1 TetR family transcriptional regulator [Deinococcus sedimenti]
MPEPRPTRRRADAQRNALTIIQAAADLFAQRGIDVPVRDVAQHAGVGMGTLYRHYPTRADLVVAVYQHQVDICAAAGPTLLAQAPSPFTALREWTDLFTGFLATKHGLAAALQGDPATSEALHRSFLDRLLPVCDDLLRAATASGEIRTPITAFSLMRATGNLCIGAGQDTRYDARAAAQLLLSGLTVPARLPDPSAQAVLPSRQRTTPPAAGSPDDPA